jgi:hypothetical protein
MNPSGAAPRHYPASFDRVTLTAGVPSPGFVARGPPEPPPCLERRPPMLRSLLIGTAVVLTSVAFARADDKADIDAAAKKLAESSYAWKTTTEADFGGGESEGKVDKDGLMHVKMSFFNNDVEILKKGEKGAVKTEEGWKSFEEAAGQGGQDGQPNPGRFVSRMARNLKTPAETAQQLAQAAKELKKDGDALKTELTEAGAKELMAFGGRRGGGQGPEISDAKGDAQFWIKEGVVSKVKYHVSGTINFNGNEREIDRTVTIEVKDVGSAKVEVPAEAKEKLG